MAVLGMDVELDEGGAEDVAGVEEFERDAGGNFARRMEMRWDEKLHEGVDIRLFVEGLKKFFAFAFALLVDVFEVALLEEAGVAQHDVAKFGGGLAGEDAAAEALAHELREVAGVVDVRMREDDVVDCFGVDWEVSIFFESFLAVALEEAAIEEDTFTVGFEEVHRARCRLCRAVECEFHDEDIIPYFRWKREAEFLKKLKDAAVAAAKKDEKRGDSEKEGIVDEAGGGGPFGGFEVGAGGVGDGPGDGDHGACEKGREVVDVGGEGGGNEACENAECGGDNADRGGWDEDEVGEDAAGGDAAEDVGGEGCAGEPGREGDDETFGAAKVEVAAETERKENAEHDREGKFGADVEEHEGVEDVDNEEGEAPGDEGVGAAHEDVGGEVDGGHAGGADGARGQADEIGVGPKEGDEEKAGEAHGDGTTGEKDHEELGDNHNVEARDGEDVHGAGADKCVADVFGEGRAFAEEDGAVEVGDVGRGMFEANAHAA